MNCPVCRIPMLVVEKLVVELDCCAGCQGIWFDEEELELLLDAAGITGTGELVAGLLEAPAAKTAEQGRRCPRCKKPMRKVLLGDAGDTLLDLCPRGDGLWLDRGELGRVVGALGGPSAARDRLAEYLGMLADAREAPPAE